VNARVLVRNAWRRSAAACVAVLMLAYCAGAIAADASPAPGMHRIAYVNVGPAAANPHNVAAFRESLRELGYVEGRNLIIDYRWGDGRAERLPEMIRDVLALKPDVVFSTGGPPTILAVKAATTTVPVVFITGDPLAEGVVSSLSRPGSNLTGFALLAQNLGGKRLELLRELLPDAKRVMLVWNPGLPTSVAAREDAQVAASRLGMSVQWVEARNPGELQAVFASTPVRNVDAMMVLADPVLGFERPRILAFAAQHRLPAMYFWREFVVEGGLISYGSNLTAVHRQAGRYVDKILRGTRPSELPIEQASTFELVINLGTAKSLGLTVPQSLLVRADEVIR
jgi:putative tryptophan/tyrosine transport system substrate-binding protein